MGKQALKLILTLGFIIALSPVETLLGQGGEAYAEESVRKAAEKGNPKAQTRLGSMYYEGDGVRQDKQKAFYWYSKASAQGYALAQTILGNMYYGGDGIKKDIAQACKLWKKAAKQNFASAKELAKKNCK